MDQIVSKLRKADVELGKGKKVPEVCKELEVTEQTYYRWRQKYGGMQPVMVKQLKSLEKENSRLKKLVADQALDMEILKEAAKGNWYAPNVDGARLLKCVDVWGPRRYRSVERVACSINHEGRSVISRVRRRMSHGYFEKCGNWPGSGPGSGPTGSISY